MSTEAADICRDAAQIISGEGWFSSARTHNPSSFCLWNALRESARRHGHDNGFDGTRPLSLTRNAIAARLGLPTVWNLAAQFAWNDAPGRTSEDVQKLLLQVADDLEVAS